MDYVTSVTIQDQEVVVAPQFELRKIPKKAKDMVEKQKRDEEHKKKKKKRPINLGHKAKDVVVQIEEVQEHVQLKNFKIKMCMLTPCYFTVFFSYLLWIVHRVKNR